MSLSPGFPTHDAPSGARPSSALPARGRGARLASGAVLAALLLAPLPFFASRAEAQGRGGGGHAGGSPSGGARGGGAPAPSGGRGYGHGGGVYVGGWRGGWYGPGWGGWYGPGWGGWWGPYWGGWWGWGPTFVVQSVPNFAIREYGIVKTDVTPEEAELWLDGKYIGRADDFDGYPDNLYLRPGSYTLEFRCPNYEPLVVAVEARRGVFLKIDRKMKLLPGKGKLDAFPKTREGMPYGRVFGPQATPELQPRPDGGGTDGSPRADVRVAPRDGAEPGEARPADAMPPPPSGRRAKLAWKVVPADAAVYVDDEYLGSGDELAALPRGTVTQPGRRSVTVVRPGYRSKTFDVEAKVGEIVVVEVTLERAK